MNGDSGRKYKALMIFLGLSTLETLVAMYFHVSMPDGVISAQSGATIAFMVGNAAVSWAYAKNSQDTSTVSETVTREVKAKTSAPKPETPDA